MKVISLVYIIAITFLLSSCSSYFKRKECESINWYDYGFQVAMSGKRLSNDDRIIECKKVEAEMSESQLDLGFKAGMSNYCKTETVWTTGKKGLFFNSEFCDPGQSKMLTQKHHEGVLLFCEAKNGYTVGASGNLYNQICPKILETPFLQEYKKGRKKYLNQSILENEQRISKLSSDAIQVNQTKNHLEYELRTVETVQLVRPNQVSTNNQQADPVETKRKDLKSKISQQESQLGNIERQKNKLQDEIFQQKKELITLDE